MMKRLHNPLLVVAATALLGACARLAPLSTRPFISR
jgi:hypothetical protein